MDPDREPALITPRFITITVAGLFYFIAFAMLLPTLPRYVENELGGSSLQVGLVVGSFGVSAALVRPLLGRLGDRFGRRVLLVVGAATSAVMFLLYPVWLSMPVLVLLRFVTGVGEAGSFVGIATATQDLAPDDRRGEASSYFGLAVYLGLGIGPFVGEYLDERSGFEAVARASFACALLAAVLGFAIPAAAPAESRATGLIRSKKFLHPAAVLPGLLLMLSLVGYVGYASFLALYLDDLTGGEAGAGTVFLLYAGVVVLARVAFGKLPDTLGPRRGAIVAFGFIALGLAIVAGWPSLVGVYIGTAVLGFGTAFNFPALIIFVMAATEPHERSHSVASFGFFFDVAGALGAPLLGSVIFLTDSYRAAFAVGAIAPLVALFGLRFLPGGSHQRSALDTPASTVT